MSDVSVSKKYKNAVKALRELENFSGRKDTDVFQQKLTLLVGEFNLIRRIVDLLALFSNNESVEEITASYIPFLNVHYYLANLYGWVQPPQKATLEQSKLHYVQYIQLLEGYGLLSPAQKQLVDRIVETKPLQLIVYDDWEASNRALSPMERRQAKIDTHKEIKSLTEKLSILEEQPDKEDEDADILDSWDEDTVRQVYLDQVRLFVLVTFNQLESLLMELELVKNAPPEDPNRQYKEEQEAAQEKERSKPESDPTGYTSKVETLPWNQPSVSQLVSKQGKILQPFTIVSNRSQLREKVFGTGQVLPSMTVEEYLDYELANGKLMKDEVKDKPKNEDDTDAEDEEEEIKNRLWDDWKDDHPKGSGNMKANLG